MTEPRRLLVVDDQAEICELIQMSLVDHGYEVDCASNAVSAKDKLDAGAYDLVILDIVMPGDNGLEVATFANERKVRVLLISGHPDWIADATLWSSYPLLPKPFRLEELAAAVRSALEARPEIAPPAYASAS